MVSADLINLYYIKIVFNKAVNMSKEDFVNKNISTFAGIYMSSCVSRRIPENSAFKDDEFVHNNIIENNIAERITLQRVMRVLLGCVQKALNTF